MCHVHKWPWNGWICMKFVVGMCSNCEVIVMLVKSGAYIAKKVSYPHIHICMCYSCQPNFWPAFRAKVMTIIFSWIMVSRNEPQLALLLSHFIFRIETVVEVSSKPSHVSSYSWYCSKVQTKVFLDVALSSNRNIMV